MADVGKYDSLWVYQRDDGLRWSLQQGWVTEDSNEFTSWLDVEVEEFEESEIYKELPPGGKWIDINEP